MRGKGKYSRGRLTLYTCPRCGIEKDISNFYPRGGTDRITSYCKKCNSDYKLESIRKFKNDAVQYKGGKCSICGYNKCNAALEFHHLDPTQKDFVIASSSSKSLDFIKKELDKCILLCSNCHREVHYQLVA